MSQLVTHGRLLEILDYDPLTGVFVWKIKTGRARVGSVAGTPDEDGYIIIRIAGRGYKAHRLAWFYMKGVWPDMQLDHEDEDKTNNRILNLREATPSQNALNKSPANANSSSGFRWVSWFAQYQKWKGAFKVAGKHYFVGHFDNPEVAYNAVKAEREKVMSNNQTQLVTK